MLMKKTILVLSTNQSVYQFASESGGIIFGKAGDMLADDLDVDPIDEGGWGEVNIKQNTYYFRIYYKMTADFPDQKYISSWAVEATKYMSKRGIIKGDTKGNFMPKAITTAQEAAGYGMASREAAVMMAVRSYEAVR